MQSREVSGRTQSAHHHLCLLCSQSRPAPGLGNTAAHVWKGLNPLSRAETINGLFCPGKKCYLFSLALKGVKNQDCDHNRDQPVAYAHQCLQLTFWEFIIAAKGWKMIRTPQKQSSCHEFLKVSPSPGPEAQWALPSFQVSGQSQSVCFLGCIFCSTIVPWFTSWTKLTLQWRSCFTFFSLWCAPGYCKHCLACPRI